MKTLEEENELLRGLLAEATSEIESFKEKVKIQDKLMNMIMKSALENGKLLEQIKELTEEKSQNLLYMETQDEEIKRLKSQVLAKTMKPNNPDLPKSTDKVETSTDQINSNSGELKANSGHFNISTDQPKTSTDQLKTSTDIVQNDQVDLEFENDDLNLQLDDSNEVKNKPDENKAEPKIDNVQTNKAEETTQVEKDTIFDTLENLNFIPCVREKTYVPDLSLKEIPSAITYGVANSETNIDPMLETSTIRSMIETNTDQSKIESYWSNLKSKMDEEIKNYSNSKIGTPQKIETNIETPKKSEPKIEVFFEDLEIDWNKPVKEGRYTCPICNKDLLKWVNGLQKHYPVCKSYAGYVIKDSQCLLCNKSFKSHWEVVKHLDNWHKDFFTSVNKDIFENDNDKELYILDGSKCLLCRRKFKVTKEIFKHLDKVHQNYFHCKTKKNDEDQNDTNSEEISGKYFALFHQVEYIFWHSRNYSNLKFENSTQTRH